MNLLTHSRNVAAGLLLFAPDALMEAAPVLLSRTSSISTSASGDSFAPSIASDGSYVVFVSAANNLVTNETPGGFLNVFMHDLTSGSTRLVSTTTNRIGGRGNSLYPQISSNGLFIAFSSEADDLRPSDTNLISDVFLHNVATGSNALVSTRPAFFFPSPANLGPPILGSSKPVLTPNGRWITFESTDPNIIQQVPNDTNRIRDIVFRDMLRPTNIWASLGAAPTSTTNFSAAPSISDDGSRVAFLSTAAGLAPVGGQRPFNPGGDVYVRDITPGKIHWASSNVWYLTLQNPANWYPRFSPYSCFPPVINASGSIVSFKASRGPYGVPAAVLQHNLQSNVTTIVASNCIGNTPLAVTPDGRFIAYESTSFLSNFQLGPTNIFLCYTESGTHIPVSIDAAGNMPTNGASRAPVITQDGRWVAFLSTAPELVNGQTNGTQYQLYVRDLLLGVTRLASFNTNGEPSLKGVGETVPSLSADGRKIAFDYTGSDLVPGDNNEASDVFLYDLDQNQITLISGRHPDLPSRTANIGNTSERPSASADGRFVAFTGYDNLAFPGDTNRQRDAFIADQETGSVVPLSLNTNGQLTPGYRALQPLLSADGRHALFLIHSNPAPLTNGIFPNHTRVPMRLLRRDLAMGTTIEVDPDVMPSTNAQVFTAFSSNGLFAIYNKTNGQFWHADFVGGTNRLLVTNLNGGLLASNLINPLLSPNDRWLVFQYRGSDLTTNALPTSTNDHLFAYDLQTHTTTLISADTNGTGMQGNFNAGNFDQTGMRLVFSRSYRETFFNYQQAYLFDFAGMTAGQVCSNCANPFLSRDARTLLFNPVYPNFYPIDSHIVIKDLESGVTNLVTANQQGAASSFTVSSRPLLSANGRYVIFQSRPGCCASPFNDLVANDTNGAHDIFMRDLLRGKTTLISANRFGTSSGNAASLNPILTRDGNTLIFQSFAGDLTDGDYNGALDLFSVLLNADDADNDGLDDTWEMTFFSTLDQQPDGDFDGDTHTNVEEFMAGTDPTNSGSVLEVLTIRSLGTGWVELVWSAVPGRRYVVQYKDTLDTSWYNLAPIITATSATATTSTASPPSGRRFYRVALTP